VTTQSRASSYKLSPTNKEKKVKKLFYVIRNGEIKMMRDDFTFKSDGTIWCHGTPLLGITDKVVAAKAQEAAKRKAWDEIPADAYTKLGVNANGLTFISQEDYSAQTKAEITPAMRERAEISAIYSKAHKLENSSSEDNVSGPMRLRARANTMLDAWRTKYPNEAKKETNGILLAKAQELRSKAIGALTYDADGWITQEEQQKRHDDFIKQAEALEAQTK